MRLRSFSAFLSGASAAGALSLSSCTVLVGDGGYSFHSSSAGEPGAAAASAGADAADAGAGLEAGAAAEVSGASGSSHGGSDTGTGGTPISSGEAGIDTAGGQTGVSGRGGAEGSSGGAGATGAGGGAALGGMSSLGGGAGVSFSGAAGAAVCSNCLQVYYENTASPESTTEIEIHFGLRNAGTQAIDLSKVSVRYYFNADGCSFSGWGARCDSSLLSLGQTECPAVDFALLPKAKPTADTYVGLTLTAAGMLSPSAIVAYEYIGAFNRSSYDCTFHQANDYSYRPNTPDFVLSHTMTAYLQGALVWGSEP